MNLKHLLAKCQQDKSLIVAPRVEVGKNYKASKKLEAECRAAGAVEFFPYLPVDLVIDSSPLEYRRAVELLGFFFQNELNFDMRPYHADYANPRDRIYVWTSGNILELGPLPVGYHAIVGACGFCWEDGELVFGWIYIHPNFRKNKDKRLMRDEKGLLETAWPLFRMLHGDFRIPFPHSGAFSSFLRKMNENVDEYGLLQPKFIPSEL